VRDSREIDDAHIRREKQKARALRRTEWWHRKLAKGTCQYCGKKAPAGELTMDHIVPLVRGGKSTKGNLAAVCKTCNTAKQSRLLFEWSGDPGKAEGPDSPGQ